MAAFDGTMLRDYLLSASLPAIADPGQSEPRRAIEGGDCSFCRSSLLGHPHAHSRMNGQYNQSFYENL